MNMGMLTDMLKEAATSHRRLFKWAAIVLVVYTLAGFVILPSVIKPFMMKKLSELVGRQVTVERVEVNPFALSVTIKGFSLKDKAGTADDIAFKRLYVNLETLSIFKQGVIVGELSLDSPYVNVVRNKDLTYNLSYLLELGGKDNEKPKDKSPLRFTVNNIRITGGRVEFDDTPENVSHKITDIAVSVPFVSNFGYYGNAYVQPSFYAVVNGTPFELKGKTKPFADSLETEFNIVIERLDIPKYMAYLPTGMNFSIPAGTLDADTTVTYKQYRDGRPPEVGVAGSAGLTGFKLADKAGAVLVTLPGLEVGISRSNLLAREIVLSRVALDSPGVDVVREADGSINLLKLVEKEEGPREEPSPYSLEVGFFQIAKGWVSFTDHAASAPFNTSVGPIDLTAVNMSNVRGWKTQVGLTTRTGAGEKITLSSQLTIDPPGMEGTLDVSGVQLKRYEPYYPAGLDAEVMGGVTGISTRFAFKTDEASPARRLDGLAVELSSFALKKKGGDRDILSVPSLSIADTTVDMLAHEVTVGSVATAGGVIRAERYKDGIINFATLYNAGPATKKVSAKDKGPEKPWVVAANSVAVKGYAVEFRDMAAPAPVTLDMKDLDINGSGLSTAKGARGQMSVSLSMGRRGSVRADGEVGISPLTADIGLNVKDIAINPVQPYFADKVALIIKDGYVSADGRVTADMSRPSGMRLTYRGMAAVTELATVDRQGAEELISWKSLYVNGIDFANEPMKIAVKEVAINDVYAKIVVNPDRSLNILKAASPGDTKAGPEGQEKAKPGKPAATQPGKSAPAKITVDKITVQAGRLNFTDRSINPTFQTDLSQLGGRVTGLSSLETKFADVDMRGVYSGFAPVEITGRVNPLRTELFIDLMGKLTDVDMSPFTPYSGKFLGYKIKKGKLSLDLKYFIDKGKLEASNKIFIDQFTLGDPVDSPDATSLPVKLAIALLKDRNGEIHLDIPLTGSLKDPEFSILSIVLKVVVNVIVKAVTSPFALLGSLFGGGEDLGYVEFAYGQATLDEKAVAKLAALEKALYDRPALKLSIEGHVDVERDREGLRKITFDRMLKAEKYKEVIGKADKSVSVDDMVIAPDEYIEYLTLAYKEADFPKPRNIIFMLKKLPPEEMEKLMMTHIEIADDDLRQLAARRTAAIKGHILASKQVEPGRVFTIEPQKLPPEKQEGAKDSRAVFTLE